MGRHWQQLHSLVYVVVLLGLWHYFWQVKKDIGNPLIYAAVVALLLGWRIHRQWQQGRRLRQSQGAAAPSVSFDDAGAERAS